MNRISPDELADLLASRPVALLDVRTAAEDETAHIPGSTRVSLDELHADTDAVAALLPDHAIVVCRSGTRAELACQVLAGTARNDLRILDGDIQAWHRVGGEVARDREHWDLERQVRLVADSLVLTGGVGAGLEFAATTNTCAVGPLLAKLPYNRSAASETPRIAQRFAQLAREATAAA